MIENYEEIEKQFDPCNGWTCKHCGELVYCDAEKMDDHLDLCDEYQKTLGDIEN